MSPACWPKLFAFVRACIPPDIDVKLRRALQPLLEESLQLSVQSNPRMLADALFPIFGKAIRKAITSELDGMLQSLSQTLEQSFSWRSLQWRWESFSTRQALRRNCRVAQPAVPRRAGLPDSSQFRSAVTACGRFRLPEAETKDPEMVSGMLTAIQDFVRDSVSGAGSETLETVRMGEIEVVLAYGPDAILAGFVRGVAPTQAEPGVSGHSGRHRTEESRSSPHFLRRYLAVR